MTERAKPQVFAVDTLRVHPLGECRDDMTNTELARSKGFEPTGALHWFHDTNEIYVYVNTSPQRENCE